MMTSELLPSDLAKLHAGLIRVAREAGAIALRDFRPGQRTTATIDWKAGGSPVTAADLAVDRFLGEALSALAPFGLHSEERPESWNGHAAHAFVIDPIDGTRDFADGGDAWCIVIGVLHEGRPIAGAVHLPARNITYSAFRGGGALRNGTRLVAPPPIGPALRVTGPRPAIEHFSRQTALPLTHAMPVPALAHRVLTPLDGEVDLALARAGGHDWDIVASDCILREAGGSLLTIDGHAPVYALEGREQPPLVAGSGHLLEKLNLPGKSTVSYLTNPA
jgi:myo-inositol-1(or 4)-monophosphatase